MQPTIPRILFVDDDADTRFMVEVWLGNYNYLVTTAESLASGLRLAQSTPFDLYILDTKLPDGSGAELCAKIRQFDPHTPVIFFSGDDTVWGSRTRECGAQAFVLKPELDNLRQSIFRFMNTLMQT